jgi:uncharacterized protein (DUF362 family)/Pyruvate/2-oxoacid:ferredoxin oxidoreductase delta subunit
MPAAARERVLVRSVTDVGLAVSEALDFLGFHFAGRKVWVKPNLLSSSPPVRSITTDPEVVRHCVRGLRRRGASEVWVGDNPGGSFKGTMEEFVAPTGVIEASEGCFVDAGADPGTLGLESRFVPRVAASHLLFDADVILNLPVLKTHALTFLTGAIKNMFGVIPGRQKTRLHGKARSAYQFSELLVDIFAAIDKPVLNIMDSLRGMDGQSGPSSGRVLSIGKLLAGRNAVAIDAVMALMAGAEPERIPMLRIAAERGLGPIRRDQLDIIGDFSPIRGFRLPGPAIANIGTFLSGYYYTASRSKPLLKARLCTECRQCAENCPARAVRMSPLPVIDRKTCIACYCCVEICPAHALVVGKGLRGIWNRVSGR